MSTVSLASNVFKDSPSTSLGYTLEATRTSLAWTDTEALLSATDCGPLLWSLSYNSIPLTTDSTQLFSLDSVTNSFSVYSTDPADVADYTLTVTVALVNYPTITASKEFIVSIT